MNKDSSRSIRVLVIGRFTAIHAVRFAEELQRQGMEVAALWIGPGKSNPNVRVYHAEGSMRVFGIPRTATIGSILYIRRAIRDFHPDIIHVQDDYRIPYWLNLICPTNVIRAYTNWGHNPELSKLPTFRKGISNIDILTSDAPDVLAEITPLAPNARREIIRFGADPDLLFTGELNPNILSQYGLDAEGCYILSPRSLRPVYNQLTLVRALPPVMEKFPNLRLILKHHHLGNFNDHYDYENSVRDEAKRLGIWDRIIRLNHLPFDHLTQLYRLCRAAVSIPLEDGFPATIFEAMACRCPLVVSNDRSYDGVIVHGKNSIAISPTDTAALSNALILILADSKFANDLRRGSIEDSIRKR